MTDFSALREAVEKNLLDRKYGWPGSEERAAVEALLNELVALRKPPIAPDSAAVDAALAVRADYCERGLWVEASVLKRTIDTLAAAVRVLRESRDAYIALAGKWQERMIEAEAALAAGPDGVDWSGVVKLEHERFIKAEAALAVLHQILPCGHEARYGIGGQFAECFRCQAEELEALKGRTCATCRHQKVDRGIAYFPGTPTCDNRHALIKCESVGFTCGAWDAKEGANETR